MVYLLAPHASALQMNTTKFKQDFIGPLFIDTALDKMHYSLKDVTGLLLDDTYHVNHIKCKVLLPVSPVVHIALPGVGGTL